ncbi:MAG: hypothetical protein DLM61_27745 [Pseudonocardiales bacterium]|nr:MAG: hypothetical protein DLM61_27745 [Pseudonocardiales bacterium]
MAFGPSRAHRPGRRSARLRRRPPAHRTLLAFCLGGLVLLLMVQGFSERTVGASGTPGGGLSRATPLAGMRPLLTAQGGRLRSTGPLPGRRIALTFDDGPSSRWTPKIATVLRANHVPATFFVVGSQVSNHPAIVRRLHRESFEIGNHTFTHADLSTLPRWEAAAQVGLTESILTGTAGIRPRLLRPPPQRWRPRPPRSRPAADRWEPRPWEASPSTPAAWCRRHPGLRPRSAR